EDGEYRLEILTDLATDNYPTNDLFELGLGVDGTDPVTNYILDGTIGDNDWYVSDVTVTLDPSDEYSGLVETKYKLDGGNEQIYTDPFDVTEDGPHAIEYWSVDIAGNEESHKTTDFEIDQTMPIIDLTWEASGLNKIIFTAACSDNTSGINRVEFFLQDALQSTDNSSPYAESLKTMLFIVTIPAVLSVGVNSM
ncbi:unnamed protein product, partial [marine sediment metagenome]